MKLYCKDDVVIATHDDSQDVPASAYGEGIDLIIVPAGYSLDRIGPPPEDGEDDDRRYARPELSGDVATLTINAERDRRIRENFVFNGKQFDFDPGSKQRVTGAATLAKFAVVAGAQPDDLRWINPAADFSWIAADNSAVPMDAQTCSAFGDAAAVHEQTHIFAARALKDMSPVPADFADDSYWP